MFPADAEDVDRTRLVIVPHHPDRLRRPGARPGVSDDRVRQALTWNIFRTLELLPPAFWLRRLHLRLTGEPLTATPHTVQVSLWRALPLPPIQRIDGGLSDVAADAVIETEHGAWTFLAARGAHWSEDEAAVAPLIDAGAWLAGARDHYCGVIEAIGSDTPLARVLETRYARSRESVALRSATRGPARPDVRSVRAMRWRDLGAVLSECADAPNLSPVERAVAAHTRTWLRQALGR